MSPPQDFTVNTHHIGSDRDRKMASLNSCRCPCASGTAVDWKGESEQPSRVKKCFGLFGLTDCWEEEVRYKEKEMSPQPLGANLKPALSFKIARMTAAHLCCLGFRCSADVSAHFCANAVSCGDLCSDRKANTTQRWGNRRFGFVCAAASRFEPGVTPCEKLCKGKPEQCGVRGKTTTSSGICRWSKREMAGWLRLGQ